MNAMTGIDFEQFWELNFKEKNIFGDDIARAIAMLAYEQGLRDGLAMYAHWKDGQQFVGTAGRTLTEALERI